MGFNKPIQANITDIENLPLSIIKRSILSAARSELNAEITFSNIKDYKTLIIKHTELFINSHLKTPTSENKSFSFFK